MSIPNRSLVGVYYYRANIKSLLGWRSRKRATVYVELEDQNIHDSRAVRVSLKGLTIGYLSRGWAREFRANLARNSMGRSAYKTRALITEQEVYIDYDGIFKVGPWKTFLSLFSR